MNALFYQQIHPSVPAEVRLASMGQASEALDDMSSVASKLSGRAATYADLEALPDGARAELLSGAIVTEPAPLPEHSNVQRRIGVDIGSPFQDRHGSGGPGGWWILLEVEVEVVPGEIVRPDVAGWRRERLPNPAAMRPIAVVPDWACEVISPTSGGRDRVYKRALYARAGVAHYWLIDPHARELLALELRDGVWVEIGAYDESATARVPPFAEVELEIGRLFLPR